MRDNCEPTPFCDECAHSEVERLAALVERLGNALRGQNERWGLCGNESQQALKDLEELKRPPRSQRREQTGWVVGLMRCFGWRAERASLRTLVVAVVLVNALWVILLAWRRIQMTNDQ